MPREIAAVPFGEATGESGIWFEEATSMVGEPCSIERRAVVVEADQPLVECKVLEA